MQRFCNMRRRYHCQGFNSKGAVLVIVWNLLATTAYWTLHTLTESQGYTQVSKSIGQGKALYGLTLVSAPFVGWLADAKLGNHRVVKIGLIALLAASVLNCVYYLAYYNTPLSAVGMIPLQVVFSVVVTVLHWIGNIIIVVNVIQLALEQLPDGSAENITSLISWIVFSYTAGVWFSDVIFFSAILCGQTDNVVFQLLSLFPVLFISIALSSYYILSPKWLITEPKSPQSLKNIFRVLKFAAKHKAPLNRSALTYWEEDVPSRLDLGKSRFGGPFTTEQVEDVKTFFRLLAVSIPLFLIMLSLRLHKIVFLGIPHWITKTIPICEGNAMFLFTFDPWWCILLTVGVHVLVIYPCCNYRLPTLMKRIGFVAFAVVVQNVTYLVLTVLDYCGYVDTASWLDIANSMLYGVLSYALLLPSLEFVCAQSPYNMRGLMMGYLQLLVWIVQFLADILTGVITQNCPHPYCLLTYASIAAALSIFAFVLYLIIARWYKRRVRDNDYSPHMHRVVEEVYERTISANAADRRSRGFKA